MCSCYRHSVGDITVVSLRTQRNYHKFYLLYRWLDYFYSLSYLIAIRTRQTTGLNVVVIAELQ